MDPNAHENQKFNSLAFLPNFDFENEQHAVRPKRRRSNGAGTDRVKCMETLRLVLLLVL